MVKTAVLNNRVQETGIYPDIYKKGSIYELSEQSQQFISEDQSSSDLISSRSQSQGLGLPFIPEIQEATYQVPCGAHSIFDPAHKVPAFTKAVYLIVCEHSNWNSSVSHPLSLRYLAELLNVKNHSQAHRALKWLIEHGWMKVEGKCQSDGTYFYRVVHHKCDPQDTPVDKDGRPQKCAVPRGKGSASQLLANGEITWKIFVDWTTRKVHSCWTSGVVSISVLQATKLMRFTAKTVSENSKKMMEIGMLKKLSAPFKLSEYQMFPKPPAQ